MDNVQISSSMALLLMDTMVERGYRKQSRRRFWQSSRIPEWTSKTMTAHTLQAAVQGSRREERKPGVAKGSGWGQGDEQRKGGVEKAHSPGNRKARKRG